MHGGQSPPVTNERVTLASLATLMRTELDATQEGVAAAEKGAVDMCHQLQNELDDFRRRDGDDHYEPATPVRRVEEK